MKYNVEVGSGASTFTSQKTSYLCYSSFLSEGAENTSLNSAPIIICMTVITIT
jgi:hypothetical protein